MKPSHAANMATLKQQFDKGNKRAALDALCVCVCSDPAKPVPPWARDAFAQALHDVMTLKATSWDDVFGKPHKKGTKVEQVRQERRLRYQVTKRVLELRRQKPKPKKINETVADQFKIGIPTVKRYFDAEMKWFSKRAR